eukprot:scaffold1233_cov395-Prasinococcus_capsulatus_cf.AAC.2
MPPVHQVCGHVERVGTRPQQAGRESQHRKGLPQGAPHLNAFAALAHSSPSATGAVPCCGLCMRQRGAVEPPGETAGSGPLQFPHRAVRSEEKLGRLISCSTTTPRTDSRVLCAPVMEGGYMQLYMCERVTSISTSLQNCTPTWHAHAR